MPLPAAGSRRAARLARHPELDMTGIDLCRPALELGRGRCEELDRPVRFLCADARAAKWPERFQVVMAIDVLPDGAEDVAACLQQFSRLLSDDGLLVVSSGLPVGETWGQGQGQGQGIGEVLSEARLGLLAVGCLGGCPGVGLEPLAQAVMVFRRGGEPMAWHEDQAELAWHGWPEFLDYAADPGIPDREKTQAWFRSR